jgi:hypothetical protein
MGWFGGRVPDRDHLPKEKPGFWTGRRPFEQVRDGSNIQLLSYSLGSLYFADKDEAGGSSPPRPTTSDNQREP